MGSQKVISSLEYRPNCTVSFEFDKERNLVAILYDGFRFIPAPNKKFDKEIKVWKVN